MIVAPLHKNLKELFPDYSKKSKKVNLIHNYSWLYRLVLSTIADLNNQSNTEERQLIDGDSKKQNAMAQLIRQLYTHASPSPHDLFPTIKMIISNNTITDHQITHAATILNKQIKQITDSNAPENISLDSSKKFFDLSTIHGVKGETHRSTLLILNSTLHQSNNPQPNVFFKVLKPFLIGRRIHYKRLPNKKTYKNSLKLAYVALSRPQYLAIIAIPQKDMSLSYREQLINSNWKEAL